MLRTHFDLCSVSNVGGTYMILNRIGSNGTIVILPQAIEHFYDLGDRGYLVGKAKELYNKTKENRNAIHKFNYQSDIDSS